MDRKSFGFNGYHCLKGQSLAEYSLVLGLVSIALIGSLSLLGQNLNDSANSVNSSLVAFGNNLTGTSGGTGAGFSGLKSPPPLTSGNGGIGGGGTTTSGGNPNNVLGTQNVCIKPDMCFNIPTPTQGGQKVSDVSGDMGQEMIKQYAQTMNQVLAELRKDDPSLLAQFPELEELANRGHRMGETLDGLLGFCKQNQIATCTSQDINEAILYSQQQSTPGSSQQGGGSSSSGPTLTRPEDTIAAKRAFQEQVLAVKNLFNGALKDRVSEPNKNLVKLMSDQINRIHTGAISTYSEDMEKSQYGERDPNIWNWTTVPGSGSTEEMFNTKPSNAAELIKIDSNVICGVGQGNTCTK
jgi:Flp pilus assembly pilin Flp